MSNFGYYVEQQCWAHWPKVLIMRHRTGRGPDDRRRYVPELTCRDANDGGSFVCSECGAHAQIHDIGRSYVDEWGKRWYATSNEHGLKYCPNCGRRIEVDDD